MTTHLYLLPKLRVRGAASLAPKAREQLHCLQCTDSTVLKETKRIGADLCFQQKGWKCEASESHAHEYEDYAGVEEYLEIKLLNDTAENWLSKLVFCMMELTLWRTVFFTIIIIQCLRT